MIDSPAPAPSASTTTEPGPPRTPMAVLEAIAMIDYRLGQLVEEAKPLRARISALDKERGRLSLEKGALKTLLEEMRKGVYISDHAVIRYLERHYGFDFEHVRREIATPALREAAAVGAVGVKVAGGTFKLKGRTVTTYIDHGDG